MRKLLQFVAFFLVISANVVDVWGQADEAILPPALPWDGKSKSIIVSPKDPWITPAEKSQFVITPRYDETVAWLRKLVAAAPELEMVSIGKSHEQRDIWMVIASQEQSFSPNQLRESSKPLFLVQAGIHSGEIDGKDAGLMLLRDITVRGTKSHLLAGVNLLFVPIFSVDGHERFSRFSRINQRGPREMGWRTNAQNLNLNRDYAKVDTPEMRAIIKVIDHWRPDLYYDIHVTDGVDYQYDITFGYNDHCTYSPQIGTWFKNNLIPTVNQDLKKWGHIPGPLVFAIDNTDIKKGIMSWNATPRYSNGYGDARHLPTILVENHSLKPYKQRVLGTYIMLESTINVLAQTGQALQQAIAADQNNKGPEIIMTWSFNLNAKNMEFLGVASQILHSDVSLGKYVRWLGKPENVTIPVYRNDIPAITVKRPNAYWIPAAWPEVIERLAIHGIQMERIHEPRTIEADFYRIKDAKLGQTPFEGRVRVSGKTVLQRQTYTFARGSVRIPTDQPLGTLAVLLLEPDSPDSLFQWGFFLSILQRTEYVEGYVMEPTAQRILAADPDLRVRFAEKLKDPAFAKSPRKRLEWLYQNTPFYDERTNLYPVARE